MNTNESDEEWVIVNNNDEMNSTSSLFISQERKKS